MVLHSGLGRKHINAEKDQGIAHNIAASVIVKCSICSQGPGVNVHFRLEILEIAMLLKLIFSVTSLKMKWAL